jgi:hypothetical protein
MARQPQNRNNTSINPSKDNDGFYAARLIKITEEDIISGNFSGASDPLTVFLLNPSTWDESKVGGWVSQTIPGQSDPVLQWVAGGATTVNFDALVTKDTIRGMGLDSQSPVDILKQSAVNAVGSIASSFFGVNIPSLQRAFDGSSGAGEDLSIERNLNYYRSLMYASYSQDQVLKNSPPIITLKVGKTFGPTSMTRYWVVTNLKIKITKQLPNLTPMEAIVSFQLQEYIINTISSEKFTSDIANKSESVAGKINPQSIAKSFL